ncbi:MAG: hypothetical protein OQL19_02235 [Gammaproteobacteria bacterium]|nr:hypothetical protein [Gammaproteobacteria bacterium]
MEKCYNYFDCQQTECIMFECDDDHPCWETEGTLCFFPPLKPLIQEVNHKEKCDFCLYKNHMQQQA